MLDDYDDDDAMRDGMAPWFEFTVAAVVWFIKLTLCCALLTFCALYWYLLGLGIVAAFED